MYPIEALGRHASLWSRIQPVLQPERFPQAVLFAGSKLICIPQFVTRVIATLLCENLKACGQCRQCRAIIQGIHPDVYYIRANAQEKSIKIDEIRALQQNIYQPPTWGQQRFIVIENADKMNQYAANALLKILEEPPLHAHIILIAEQVNFLLPTITSRCQQYRFSLEGIIDDKTFENYLLLGNYQLQESREAALFAKRSEFLDELADLLEEKISPCTIAEEWLKYGIDAVLWFLYLISAQLLRCRLTGQDTVDLMQSSSFQRLKTLLEPARLLMQIDSINALTAKINHNVNMNQKLAIETLLLGYLREMHE